MIATGSGMKEENKVFTAAERFCRRFSLAEVQLATQDFSDAHLIGIGGFGKVYKGQIDNGQQMVAIKRLASNSNQGEGEFFTEIETLSKLRHVNLVSLIGYCNENGEMILVYEYIARGTLADHLYNLSRSSESDDCSSLTWKQCLNICIGAGRGLDYLHTGSSIIHRDVKSTNILLDEKFTAKVSDFGLAKHLCTSNSKSHVSTIVKGTFGYLDPSYFVTCRLTRKSDTYAFGVVLLEVLCGRQAVDQRLGEDEMSLVIWAHENISRGKVHQIVAPNLRDEISADCLKAFVGIAKRCLNPEPKKRPTMAQVVIQLEVALQQQDKRAPTLNASRFLPFWNRVKPSGSSSTGSTQQKHKQGHVNPLSTTTQEEALNYKQTNNILSVAVPAIPIQELKDITNNFSSHCLIDMRHFLLIKKAVGNVYRGTLRSGHDAAIKKLCFSSLPTKEFLKQVSIISSLKHENVAQLLGYWVDGRQQFLAYEFAPNGSLHDTLQGVFSNAVVALSWAQRVKIAYGAAKGLEYIHKKGHIHCNIKSSNILVYNDEVVKLIDFGLSTSSLFERPDDYMEYHPTLYMRTHEYQPPEYVQDGELSSRSDVYSFGLVLLQLLTGRKLYDFSQPRGKQHLLQWTLSKLRHVNLVSLIGYCNENGEMILVYEYVARGTLADHLYKISRSSESDDCSSLTWKQRLNVCIGAARGIDYLHTGTSIIHRDIKSTNILLDENFTDKVSDFGLAKHLSISSSKSYISTIVKGSFGYIDPSYFITCRLTQKSDTYAFGVVLLEVLCGRPPVDESLGEDDMSRVMWALEKINKRKVDQIVASNLRDEISADCLKTFVGIATRCLNHELMTYLGHKLKSSPTICGDFKIPTNN